MLIYDKNTLQFIEVENKYKIPFYFCIFCCFFLVISISYSFNLISIQNKKIIAKNESILYIKNENRKTMQKIDKFIESLPFSNKKLIKKQYRLESGNLTSNITKNNFNIFGMKASSRKHTYIGIDKNGYAIYSSIEMSILDRLMYEIYIGKSLKNYAEDKNYLKKLKIK